jgi:simple sugar transport system substrate-binding protein
MEKALGAKVQTKFVENVPEGADAERVIRELAASGNKLIFTTSFGYMNPTIKVAPQFPNTAFDHATGYKTAKNVGIYNARFYEGRYLNGIIAGKMTKSNVAGYVAAFPIPEVVQGINAFTQGMRSVNPNAEVKVIWTNSWFDPGREREAANTLISQGATSHAPHRLHRRRAGRRGEGQVRVRRITPTCRSTGRRRSSPARRTSGARYYTKTASEVHRGHVEARRASGAASRTA